MAASDTGYDENVQEENDSRLPSIHPDFQRMLAIENIQPLIQHGLQAVHQQNPLANAKGASTQPPPNIHAIMQQQALAMADHYKAPPPIVPIVPKLNRNPRVGRPFGSSNGPAGSCGINSCSEVPHLQPIHWII
jgi:hypothetical protein